MASCAEYTNWENSVKIHTSHSLALYLYQISIYFNSFKFWTPITELNTKYHVWLMQMHYSVQFSSVAQSCLTLCDPMNRSTPGLPVHHQLLEFTQTHVHRLSDAIQPSHPLSSPSSPAPNPYQQLFSNESTLCRRWPKYWNFSFSISPSNVYLRLISFKTDWLDLLVVQGTLKSLLQHHRSKASILRRSAFFTVQLSHPYMTTGKP